MYADWPDFGAPDLKAMDIMNTMVSAIQKARTDFPNSPPVIHCSAGVGRTGTTITCCIITQML